MEEINKSFTLYLPADIMMLVYLRYKAAEGFIPF